MCLGLWYNKKHKHVLLHVTMLQASHFGFYINIMLILLFGNYAISDL